MQIFDRAARAWLIQQQPKKLLALPRVEDRPFGDELVDDHALLRLLQFGDRGAFEFDALGIERVGEERLDECGAMALEPGAGAVELLQEGALSRFPACALRFVQRQDLMQRGLGAGEALGRTRSSTTAAMTPRLSATDSSRARRRLLGFIVRSESGRRRRRGDRGFRGGQRRTGAWRQG